MYTQEHALRSPFHYLSPASIAAPKQISSSDKRLNRRAPLLGKLGNDESRKSAFPPGYGIVMDISGHFATGWPHAKVPDDVRRKTGEIGRGDQGKSAIRNDSHRS